jgi:hypothetical protein
MDKGIPLPELPLDPPTVEKRPDPHTLPTIGAVFLSLGAGTMAALHLMADAGLRAFWPMPLPLATLGLGLLLYHFLAATREG